jgi:muramidase (phage lysozyme)
VSNRTAFLDAIAWSEGTPRFGDENGYNVIVGGSLFNGYADHPRQSVWLPKLKIFSTAAGRYQLLARYFDAYKVTLSLDDFSPASQDAIALQQIKECRALPLVDAGDFDAAINRVGNIWASLPNNNYGQHQQSMDGLRAAYIKAGGTIA